MQTPSAPCPPTLVLLPSPQLQPMLYLEEVQTLLISRSPPLSSFLPSPQLQLMMHLEEVQHELDVRTYDRRGADAETLVQLRSGFAELTVGALGMCVLCVGVAGVGVCARVVGVQWWCMLWWCVLLGRCPAQCTPPLHPCVAASITLEP